MSQEKPAGTKEAYEKPSIERVELRPDEVVLGSCKSAGSAGPNGGSCTVPTSCSTSGS